MAVPKENSLSLGHLTRTRRDTLSKQRERSGKNSANKPWGLSTKALASESHQHITVMHLQQRLQELKERERMAQQRNRQLLQQFEEAQDVLQEMMASNAAMKTIRTEYERYLQENGPQWQKQFQEKEQRAHEKRMKNRLSSGLKSTELTADRSHTLQGTATTEEYSNFSQDRWLKSRPVQSSSHVPPSLVPPTSFPHPQPLTHHNFTSATDHHKPWLMQDPPGWASLQADHSWPWAGSLAVLAAASESLLRHLDQKERPPEVSGEEEARKASSSRRDRIDGNRRNLSPPELDTKPVRMSSSHAESTESGRDSSLASTERKKRRRGKSQHSSSQRRSSQEVLTPSCAPAVSQVTVDQSSEGDVSSENGHTSESSVRMRRSEGPAAGPQKPEKAEKEQTNETRNHLESHSEESEHMEEGEGGGSEKEASQSPEDKSQSCMEDDEEESKSEGLKIKRGSADEIEKESSSSEESSLEEKQEKQRQNKDAREDENQEKDEDEIELDRHGDDEVSARKNTTEEGTEAEDEDEMDTPEDDEDSSDREQNKDPEERKPESASSQEEVEDEDGSEGSEEDQEGSEEEEDEEEEGQSGEDGGVPTEDRDSDDSIISPQEKRPKTMQMIPEEAAEDDEGEEEEESKEGSSDEDSSGSGDEDIENLLAPQEPTNKEEKQHKSQDEPSEIRDKVMIFQVQQNSPKSDHQSDSDEFDHFYD